MQIACYNMAAAQFVTPKEIVAELGVSYYAFMRIYAAETDQNSNATERVT